MVGAPSPRSPGRLAASHTVAVAPLMKAQHEAGEYGVYSYLLYRTSPATSGRDPAVFGELLRSPAASTLAVSPDHLNLTAIPLTSLPEEADLRSTEWWLGHYDLGHSVQILVTQQIPGNGPFLVSCKVPLGSEANRQSLAILDLSAVTTEESARAWIKYFADVSQRPEDWVHNDAELILLKMHDEMAMAGSVVEALPDGSKILKAFGMGN